MSTCWSAFWLFFVFCYYNYKLVTIIISVVDFHRSGIVLLKGYSVIIGQMDLLIVLEHVRCFLTIVMLSGSWNKCPVLFLMCTGLRVCEKDFEHTLWLGNETYVGLLEKGSRNSRSRWEVMGSWEVIIRSEERSSGRQGSSSEVTEASGLGCSGAWLSRSALESVSPQ